MANTEQQIRVALVNGGWGQNIGNAFFNIGGKWVLDEVFGADTVGLIQDQPAYRTFHDQNKGNPHNDANLLSNIAVDYVVLQGPMLTRTFRPIWEDAFRAYRDKGTKVILLGAAFFKYDAEEKALVADFLKEFPPNVIVTRDHETYQSVKDLAPHTYSGIDSAFFVPRAYRPVGLALPPYITMNFDRWPEPTIRRVPESDDENHDLEFFEDNWSMSMPKLQKWFSDKGKWQSYIGALLDRRTLPAKIGEYTIIRPEHRSNPHVHWKIYKNPGAIAWDEPFTYFSLYANTSLTFSDRVHACVMTLAFGKPAMLFTPTPRAKLFERFGLNEIASKPVVLDRNILEKEQDMELEFLRTALKL